MFYGLYPIHYQPFALGVFGGCFLYKQGKCLNFIFAYNSSVYNNCHVCPVNRVFLHRVHIQMLSAIIREVAIISRIRIELIA